VSVTGVSPDVECELRAICGDEHVIRHAPDALDAIEFDQFVPKAPPISVSPGSVDEIADVARLANKRSFAIGARGGATDLSIFSDRLADVALDTTRLNEVEHYDPADLTVGVGAGMTVAQLKTMVRADGLLFAGDPPLLDQATVGGVLAAATQGPLHHGYGGLRDFCIGIRFITGDGRKAKGGGRVVKNVAGYDLMKLLIGSYGTLAVITSASFKLFPAPRGTKTFIAEFATATEALQFRDLVMRSPLAPMCLELVSPRARQLMRPETTSDAWVICVRAAGSDAVLARCRRELGSAITRELEGDKEVEMWASIENYPMSQRRPGFTFCWWSQAVINVPVSEVGTAIQVLQEFEPAHSSGPSLVGRVGLGILMVAFSTDAIEVLARVLDALEKRLSRNFSVCVCAPGKLWRVTPTDLSSMRAVKRALDPNNVLRGREIF
jgi:glycolate oxidase FAD binding subunit